MTPPTDKSAIPARRGPAAPAATASSRLRGLDRAPFVEWLLAAAIGVSCLADPVFSRVSVVEISLGIAIALAGLAAVWRLLSRGVLWQAAPRHTPLILWVVSLCGSALVSLAVGAPVPAIIRSTASYLVIAIALPAVLARSFSLDPRPLAGAIIAAGFAQAAYMLHLFLALNIRFDSSMDVLVYRITGLDARTTLPLFMAATMMSLGLSARRNLGLIVVGLVVPTACVLAAFATLTRAHVASFVVGFLALLALVAVTAVARRPTLTAGSLRVAAMIAIVTLAAVVLFLASPQFRLLPGLLAMRTNIEFEPTAVQIDPQRLFETAQRMAPGKLSEADFFDGIDRGKSESQLTSPTILKLVERLGFDKTQSILEAYAKAKPDSTNPPSGQGSAKPVAPAPSGLKSDLNTALFQSVVTQTSGKMEFGDARFANEYVPAFERFRSGTIVEKLFGIGAGIPFTTASGEARTYIHDYPLYILLYQGAFGVLAYILLYATLSWRALKLWWARGDEVALGVLGVLIILHVYALAFAVHKLVPFNLVMTAAYLIVYARPTETATRE